MIIREDDPLKKEKEVLSLYQFIWGKGNVGSRLLDIEREVAELLNYRDEENLKEETGDVLASLFAFCAEKGWKVDDLIKENLQKVEKRYNHGKYEKD